MVYRRVGGHDHEMGLVQSYEVGADAGGAVQRDISGGADGGNAQLPARQNCTFRAWDSIQRVGENNLELEVNAAYPVVHSVYQFGFRRSGAGVRTQRDRVSPLVEIPLAGAAKCNVLP